MTLGNLREIAPARSSCLFPLGKGGVKKGTFHESSVWLQGLLQHLCCSAGPPWSVLAGGSCSQFSWSFQNFSAELLRPLVLLKSVWLVVSLEFGNLNDCISKEKVGDPTGLFFPASGFLFAGALERANEALALFQATDMLHY